MGYDGGGGGGEVVIPPFPAVFFFSKKKIQRKRVACQVSIQNIHATKERGNNCGGQVKGPTSANNEYGGRNPTEVAGMQSRWHVTKGL